MKLVVVYLDEFPSVDQQSVGGVAMTAGVQRHDTLQLVYATAQLRPPAPTNHASKQVSK